MNPAKSPRVLWDMTFTARNVTGTGVYSRKLYAGIAADRGWDLRALDGSAGTGERFGNLLPHLRNLVWLWAGLENELVRAKPDLFHAAAFLGPRHAPCPMLVNVFDTSYITFPQAFDWKWHFYARTVIPRTLKNSAAILTLSEHARGEIARSYAVPRRRIHIVPPGIGQEFRADLDADSVARVRAKYKLGENYLIYVGGRSARKNVPALVEAFALARHALPDLELALAGPIPHHNPLTPVLAATGAAQAIHELDYVPQDDLPALYAGARAFVYPSKLEGFGIPPVEAMACGAPVISAPNPPMPQVLGDAACFTENDSPGALAAGILRVLQDESLRRTLREHGIHRAKLYTWENSARKTVEIYKEILTRSGRG